MNVLIAGDFCPQHRVARLCDNNGFNVIFDETKEIIRAADYSIVNFECPVVYGDEKPISKQGPSLKCSENGIRAIKWAGFKCVTLANNHFLDYGEKGALNTLAACRKHDIDVVGGGENLKQSESILYKEINKEVIAIINCCEHEFSIATDSSAGSNPLNPIRQYYKIEEAKQKADYVLVIVHGGHEMYQLPSPRMQETYRFFIDAGADAVVNHHQHCFSGYEKYKGKPIFYGLGNFCFDKPTKKKNCWYEGYLVHLIFLKNMEVKFEVVPYTQCVENPAVNLMKGAIRESFFEKIKELNTIITDYHRLTAKFVEYAESNNLSFLALFSSLNTKFGRGMVSRNIIPSLVSKKNLILMFDRISCESHRDLLVQVLSMFR